MPYTAKKNYLILTEQSLVQSTTAESDALAIATYASWVSVLAWNLKSKANQVESPNEASMYSGVKEFDLVMTCDATETLTSGALYAARQKALTVADSTFTATGASPSVITDTGHGLKTGDGPFRLTSSGTLPDGFELATDYWVEVIDANTFYIATSLANAIGSTRVAATDTGSGTHTISDKQTADGFLNTDDQTKRLHHCYMGDLNGGNTITVGDQTGFMERVQHSPLNLFYIILATSGTGAQTLVMDCAPVQTVEW